MIDLIQPWTLPIEWPVGLYFLYGTLIIAGSIQWARKRPRPPTEPTAPDAQAVHSDGAGPKPPPDSAPAQR
jgi:hypothetical protein